MTRSRITPPTQPLPWTVKRQTGQSRLPPYTIEPDFGLAPMAALRGVHVVILDANGFWVASFGPVRAEADFVCAVVNQWQEGRK